MRNLLALCQLGVMLCFVGTTSAVSDNFYFSHQSKSPVAAVEGQRLILPCDVSERDHIDFYWTFNGQPLENTTRRFQNQSQLVIELVYRHRDSGQYQCNARNRTSGFIITSSVVELDIEWIGQEAAVELISPTSASLLREGDNMTLQCLVEGHRLQMAWYHNSVRVSATYGRAQVDQNKRLHISALSVEDNGIYSCSVENGAGYMDSTKNFPLMLKRADIANIRLPPQDLTVNKGGAAQLHCVFENAIRVDWYDSLGKLVRNKTDVHEKDGVQVRIDRRIVYPNGTLYFPRVKPNGDEGSYRCAGSLKSVPSDEPPSLVYAAQLRVTILPKMTRNNLFPKPTKDSKYIVRAGSTFEAFCKVEEPVFPAPEMFWMNDKGQNITTSPFWLIERVQLTHAGTYSCRSQNQFEKEEVPVSLVVTVMPKLVKEPTNSYINEGDSFQLVCSFRGSPAPLTTISWFRRPSTRDTMFLITNSDRRRITNFEYSSTLIVRNAFSQEDSGSYRCQVLTIGGFETVYSEMATVSVRERLKFTPKPINQHHLELHGKEKIHCRAHAATRVTIRWTKVTAGPAVAFPSHVQDGGNGTLFFNGVKQSDEGVYVCTAETEDEVINATTRVDVFVLPRFTVRPEASEAVVGQDIVIHCQAAGDPVPVIDWNKDGIKFNNSDNARWQVLKNGTLVIAEAKLSDAGKYGCMAGNKKGFVREEVVVTVHQENTASLLHTLVITFSFAGGYIVLVIVLICYCKRKRSRKSPLNSQPMSILNPSLLTQPGVPESQTLLSKTDYLPPSSSGTPRTRIDSSMQTRPLSVKSTRYGKSATGSDECQFSPNTSSAYSGGTNPNAHGAATYPPNSFFNVQEFGRGNYGKIYVANMRDSAIPVVMIKALHTSDDELRREVSKELDNYKKLNHMNVVKYVGFCNASQTQPSWAVFEHSDAGDLKQFVLGNRDHLTHNHLISFAQQIAQGMQHFAELRFVHKDLATRNCVVDVVDGLPVVKVSMMSPTKVGPFEKEYCLYQQRKLPLRWMPAEAVFDDDFSTKSDVWSFGILCYELLTGCEGLPYQEFSDQEVMNLLQQGRLRLPLDGAVESERKLVEQCTAQIVSERPTFATIVNLWQVYANIDTVGHPH